MLSFSQIAKFFDHQYLWKESDDILDFLHGDSSGDSTYGRVWPRVSSQAETCLDVLVCL